MWFLRDSFSTNGTWINGVRMQPGKKYQLATNDEINFAMGEIVIFDKYEVEDDESIFIMREYIEGVTLGSVVRNLGAQPADQVIEWGKQLCDMLDYLHNLTPPHIYRDMKPANIILTSDRHLKVIDVGIVRAYDSMKGSDPCFLGTCGYAAPEQYGGYRQSDARTDIYGLGMTLYHLVTGVDPQKPPYENKPICQVDPSLPKGLEYIITKCTQLNPDKRYQNCDELMEDLNNYLNLPKPKSIFGKIRRKGTSI